MRNTEREKGHTRSQLPSLQPSGPAPFLCPSPHPAPLPNRPSPQTAPLPTREMLHCICPHSALVPLLFCPSSLHFPHLHWPVRDPHKRPDAVQGVLRSDMSAFLCPYSLLQPLSNTPLPVPLRNPLTCVGQCAILANAQMQFEKFWVVK